MLKQNIRTDDVQEYRLEIGNCSAPQQVHSDTVINTSDTVNTISRPVLIDRASYVAARNQRPEGISQENNGVVLKCGPRVSQNEEASWF